jgi:hypothetical protein
MRNSNVIATVGIPIISPSIVSHSKIVIYAAVGYLVDRRYIFVNLNSVLLVE